MNEYMMVMLVNDDEVIVVHSLIICHKNGVTILAVVE